MATEESPLWLTRVARCTKTAKSTGEQCRRPEVPGTGICRYHGGKAPQVAAKGAERVAEVEARRAFGRMADHAVPVTNPFDALASVAGEVVAWKEFCAQRIAELEHLRSVDEKGTEQIDARIALFERSLDRAVQTLATISKLGIEERLARITERQADTVVRAVEAALAAAGLTGNRVTEAKAAAARELRRVA